ncbi:MAG: hypothetical protein FJ186_00505 [Gammaproteobacteria bacterium]|nr:hypothetical protein [Gammaproteobacteria bacterium]
MSLAAEFIKQRIRQKGMIPFDEYVDIALYDLEHGFYVKEHDIKDHFVTAPMLGDWLARSLVSHWLKESQDLLIKGITEWGAGRGDLMYSIMMNLYHRGIKNISYVCVERSSGQKKHIMEKILTLPEDIRAQVKVMSKPTAITGIILANEFLDALPFKRFVVEGGKAYEQVVRIEHDELVLSKSNVEMSLPFDVSQYPDGYTSEILPVAQAWFDQQIKAGMQCLWVIIDYGYLCDEYYHIERHTGTMQAFRYHQVISNWLAKPGSCDLTAHVDFSALIKRLSDHCPYRIRTQRQYMIESGIFESTKPENMEATSLKILMLPGQMGDLVKVFEVLKKEGA